MRKQTVNEFKEELERFIKEDGKLSWSFELKED